MLMYFFLYTNRNKIIYLFLSIILSNIRSLFFVLSIKFILGFLLLNFEYSKINIFLWTIITFTIDYLVEILGFFLLDEKSFYLIAPKNCAEGLVLFIFCLSWNILIYFSTIFFFSFSISIFSFIFSLLSSSLRTISMLFRRFASALNAWPWGNNIKIA